MNAWYGTVTGWVLGGLFVYWLQVWSPWATAPELRFRLRKPKPPPRTTMRHSRVYRFTVPDNEDWTVIEPELIESHDWPVPEGPNPSKGSRYPRRRR